MLNWNGLEKFLLKNKTIDMKRIISMIWLFVGLCMFSTTLYAQHALPAGASAEVPSYDEINPYKVRHVATTVGVGYLNEYDSYLSPWEYEGIELRLHQELYRDLPWQGGQKWMFQRILQTRLGYTTSPSDDNITASLLLSGQWGVLRKWRVTPQWQVMGGATGEIQLGGLYNMRNGNNPGSLRLGVHLNASGMTTYDFRLWNYPLRASYAVQAPIVGCMFAPHYGESYYEIFGVDDHDFPTSTTWVGNHPSLTQHFSVDIPFLKTTWRLSYLMDIQQSRLNNLESHSYSHLFMVGCVVDLYSLTKR